MSPHKPAAVRRALIALTTAGACCATGALVPVTAWGQSSEIAEGINLQDPFNTVGPVRDALHGIVQGVANSPGSSGQNLEQAVGSALDLGLLDWRPSGVLTSSDPNYPLATQSGIERTELIKKEDEPGIRLQRWYVASVAMKRVVELQVMLPANQDVASPMLYMLDGISSPRHSDWLRLGNLAEVFKDQNVTVIMPTLASGSIYTDWQGTDKAQGVAKWETFLSKELPAVMEDPKNGLKFNGKRAIGGLSMGAMGAIRNAALYPNVWHATMAFSGCYSTMDPLGAIITRYIVEPRGAQTYNIWGAYGSPEYRKRDIVLNPEGLRNMPVYLFTADGHITADDLRNHASGRPLYELPAGAVLEQGTYQCTRNLDRSMRAKGMTHQKVVYKKGGTHDWPIFREYLKPGWEHIKTALY